LRRIRRHGARQRLHRCRWHGAHANA
jgi:hypothetical protein